MASARSSVGVVGLAGPALSKTILGGCLQSITLLDEHITLPPNPGPSSRCLLSVSSIYFNGIPFSISAGNCSYTPLSNTLSLVILPAVLTSVTWNCADCSTMSGDSSAINSPLDNIALALKPCPEPIALTFQFCPANSCWKPPFCIMSTLVIVSLLALL